MKAIAVIPARYAAARFPGKLMKMLHDKPVITHTYLNTVTADLFDEVLVATDSEVIFNEIKSHNGNVVMSQQHHVSCSDRIAEAISELDYDVIVIVQGDEPFINKNKLQNLLEAFNEKEVKVVSLMHKIFEKKDIENINNVKVVVSENNDALLFSRSVIPYIRNNSTDIIYYKHIGVYGYRKQTLLQFTQWQPAMLEKAESLEQLRYLEHGIHIKMVLAETGGIGIDTPEDLQLAEAYLSQMIKEK